MSYDINRIHLEGNVGGDVDVKFVEDGDITLAKFSLAQFVKAKHKTTDKFVPKWWNIRVRSKTDPNSVAQYVLDNVKKGDSLVIEGTISGWIPEEEYEREARESGYRATPVIFVDADRVRKLERKQKAGSSNREEMPPF